MTFREFLAKKEVGPIISVPPVDIHFDYDVHQFVPNKGVHQAFARTIDSRGGFQPHKSWQPIFTKISLWK